MNITHKSNMDDILAFAKAQQFEITDIGMHGNVRMFDICNLRIAENVSVDREGVRAFFIGYAQAKTRYA